MKLYLQAAEALCCPATEPDKKLPERKTAPLNPSDAALVSIA